MSGFGAEAGVRIPIRGVFATDCAWDGHGARKRPRTSVMSEITFIEITSFACFFHHFT